MKQVLIVDDERNLLASLRDGFRDHAGEFALVTAENGAKATVILRSMPVDLVITDLRMPVMDGFELLAYMSKHHPDIPTIIMTAHSSTPDTEQKLRNFSVSHCIQKPFELDDLASAILSELRWAEPGRTQGLTLPDFLQLIASEERTCTLAAEFGGEQGVLYFKQGELIDAETGQLQGDDAVRHMASWTHAGIDLDPRCAKTAKTVHSTLTELLAPKRGQQDAPEAAVAPKKNQAGAPPEQGPARESQAEAREEGAKGASAAGTTKGNTATTREILGELAKIPSIDAVCLVARDGFLLDSIARSGIDKEMIGAIASSGFGASDSMGRQLDKGTMLISMIEFDRGPVLLAPIGGDAFLVIVADKEANLGMVRLKLKKHSHELAFAAAI